MKSAVFIIIALLLGLGAMPIQAQTISEELLCKFKDACDYRNQTTVDATRKITNSVNNSFADNVGWGLYKILKVYRYVHDQWNWTADPIGGEWVPKASKNIANNYVGDCEDFAVTIASMMSSIGETTRIVVAFNESGGHAFTELRTTLTPKDVGIVLCFVSFGIINEFHYRRDRHGYVWINLDYTKKDPGGEYFEYTRYYNVPVGPGFNPRGEGDQPYTIKASYREAEVYYTPYEDREFAMSFHKPKPTIQPVKYQQQSSYKPAPSETYTQPVVSQPLSFSYASPVVIRLGVGLGYALGPVNGSLEFKPNNQYFNGTGMVGLRLRKVPEGQRTTILGLFFNFGRFNISREASWQYYGIEDISATFSQIELGVVIDEWFRLSIGRGFGADTYSYYAYLDETYDYDFYVATIAPTIRFGIIELDIGVQLMTEKLSDTPFMAMHSTLNVRIDP